MQKFISALSGQTFYLLLYFYDHFQPNLFDFFNIYSLSTPTAFYFISIAPVHLTYCIAFSPAYILLCLSTLLPNVPSIPNQYTYDRSKIPCDILVFLVLLGTDAVTMKCPDSLRGHRWYKSLPSFLCFGKEAPYSYDQFLQQKKNQQLLLKQSTRHLRFPWLQF